MTQPSTRATFKEYCKRQLGWPVVDLNVDDDQVEDRIDDSIMFWNEYHYDGAYKKYHKHMITASTTKLSEAPSGDFTDGEYVTGGTSGCRAKVHKYHSANTTLRFKFPETKDGRGDANTYYSNTTNLFSASETITGGTSGVTATIHSSTAASLGDIDNEYITLDETIIGVNSVIPFSASTQNDNLFDFKYQFALNDMHRIGSSIQSYVMTQSHINLINDLFVGTPAFRFNKHTDKVYLDIDWKSDVSIDDFVILDVQVGLDATSHPDMFRDIFLKRYCTALIKKQWGQNMIKFEGLQLPGGVTLNGRQLIDDAQVELDAIKEEIVAGYYEEPMGFHVG